MPRPLLSTAMRSRSVGFTARARILSACFVLAALLLSVRLYFVQIVHGEEHRREAEGQYVARASDVEERADIFMSEREGALVAVAMTRGGWRLVLAPRDIENPQALYEALSRHASLDEKRFFASAAKADDPYEEIAFKLDDDTAALIRKEKLPGVTLVRDQWRYYPGNSLAAHMVGFVGYKGDTKAGVYGLESFWQGTLAKISSGLYVNPFAELFMNMSAALSSDPGEGYGDIITSIEPSVEARLESVLREVRETYAPKFSAGIVMDPKTGEIIAMAVDPTFDLNTYSTVENAEIFANPLVENIYEMGSIMKPLTIAAGIDAGAITPKTTYNDKGCIEKSGKTICNHDKKARGVVDIQEVLNQSLNLGASFVADTMGHNVFGEYIHAFGLGEKTGIDLPNEARGKIHAIDHGYDVDYASASFGQSIAMTAIGMIRGLGVLANGGVLPSPHVVQGVRLESGIVRTITPEKGARALKEETVETVNAMLVKVFDEALLDGILKQEHYSIAAKTGTAQIAIPGGGGYYADRYLHSFFGYFPAHEPRFIVFLIAVEPKGVQYASASLARPFLDITKFLINYYNIPPDR